jgi:hypothetical protein
MDNIAPISAQIEVSSKSVISAIFQRWLNLLATKLNLIVDGEYTPTMVGIYADIPQSITPINFRYTRIGNNVHVFGSFTCRVAYSGSAFHIAITPPIPFNINNCVIAGGGGDYFITNALYAAAIVHSDVAYPDKIIITSTNVYNFAGPINTIKYFINFSYNIN